MVSSVDKYSDVLDSEVAECDFTDVYMNTITKPYKLEESIRPIEAEMRQQLKNSNHMYALQLRTEAADHIGIENIKKSRLIRLEQEREEIEKGFKAGNQVYPDFRLSLLVRLEA